MPQAPLSYTTATGDGVTDVFALSFPYIDETHVHFFIGTAEVQIVEFVTQSTVRVSPAPASGANIVIRRCTPICERLVDYFNGATLGEYDLDTSILQVFYRMQEQEDDLDLTGIANYGTYEVGSFSPAGLNADEYFLIHEVITTNTLREATNVSRGGCLVAPSTIPFVQEIAVNGTPIGTISWAVGSFDATIVITADTTLVPDDMLTVQNPATVDPDISGVTVSISGDR